MACSKEKEIILNVIDLYRDMPYLWQKNHRDYLNKELRSQGLKVLLEVYKNFDEKATLATFKKKLLNMRSNYNKELSKVISSKRTGAGAEEVYVPKLWYFDAFNFLGSTSEPCRSTSDTLESENSRLGLSSDEENDTQREHIASTQSQQPKKRKETLLYKQEKLLESAKNLLSTKENDWEVFGKSIGLQMKDLNKRQLTIAQKIISDVIFLAKLDRLSENSRVVTSGNIHNYPYSSVQQSPLSNYCDQSPHHFSTPSPHSNPLPPDDIYKRSSTSTHNHPSPTHYNRPSSASDIFPSLSSQNHSSLPLQNQPSSYGSQYQPSPSTYLQVQSSHPQSYQRQPVQLPKHSIQSQQWAIQVQSSPQHAIQSPQQSIQSPQNKIQSQPNEIQSPHHSIQSPHHSIQSPHHSIQSPEHSVQSPQQSIQSPQHAVQSPCHSLTSSSQTVTFYSAEDILNYVENDLGPADNFSPIITEGPANVLKEYLIRKPKK